MRIAVTNHLGDVASYDLDSATTTLRALKERVAGDMRIPPALQQLTLHGRVLGAGEDGMSLLQAGVAQDDLLLVTPHASALGAAAATAAGRTSTLPPTATPAGTLLQPPQQTRAETIRAQLLANPVAMAQLQQQNPPLAHAARNDPAAFGRLLLQLEAEQQRLQAASQAELEDLANADPFDVEAQRRIEQTIAQSNIAQNMETAMEFNPESFGRVCMLYIRCEVNGVPVKAFVDSGAQTTIISPSLAEQCKIMRLVDVRFAGIARGVGSAKILGRIHSTQLKLGSTFLPCAFTVLEGQDVDMLLGLDMLKRYQACIDLASNSLKIAGEDIPFLPEHELPDKARLADGPASPSSGEASSSEPPRPTSTPAVAGRPVPASQGAAVAAGISSTAGKTSNDPATAPATNRYPPPLIQRLVDMGATRADVLHALDAADGNVDFAMDILFGGQ